MIPYICQDPGFANQDEGNEIVILLEAVSDWLKMPWLEPLRFVPVTAN